MRAMRIVTIICWIIVAAVLVGLAGWFVTGTVIGVKSDRFANNRFFGSGINIGGLESLSGSFEVDGVYSSGVENLHSINIDWVAGLVTVKAHDGNDIQISEYAQRSLNDDEKLYMGASGGVLTIRYSDRSINLRSAIMPQKRLEVLIPRSMAGNLTKLSVDSVSGNVNIDEMSPGTLKVDTTSGDITLLNISSRELIIDSISGSISLSQITSDGIKMDTTSGSVTVNSARAGVIEMDSISGDFRVTDSSAGLIDADTTSGGLSLSGAFDRIIADSLSGNISVVSTTVPSSLKADTTSGNTTVTVPDEGAVTVNYSSTSGRFSSEVPVILQGRGAQFEFSSLSGDIKIIALK